MTGPSDPEGRQEIAPPSDAANPAAQLAGAPAPSADQPAPSADQPAVGTEEPFPPLWRNFQFQTLWFGTSASSLGINIAAVAYPLVILALTGSPARAGLFAAVQTGGQLLGGLPGGQLADRRDRRMILIVGEATRALVTGVVAVGLIFGWLALAPLLLAAAVLGLVQTLSSTARMPLVRSVVAPQQLTTALVQDEVRQNAAALAGPALAGSLYAIRAPGHAVPFLFIAGTFALSLLSAVLMKAMPGGAPGGAASRPAQDRAAGRGRKGMLVGLSTIWSHPVLRSAMTLLMMVNTIGAGLELIVIVILRDQHISSGIIGLVLSAGAVGGLAGAPLVRVLHRMRPGILLISVCLVLVPVNALFALPFGPWWAAALLFIGMLGVPAIRVLLDVLVLRQAPDDERGRVVGAVMLLLGLGMPVGTASAGLLLQWLPAATAMLICAGLMAAGVAVFATRRVLLQARWPA